MSLPGQVLLDRPWPRRSWAMQRNPRDAKKNICASQSSALTGQSWLKTIGCPLPQSLKEMRVPAWMMTVFVSSLMMVSYYCEGDCPRGTRVRGWEALVFCRQERIKSCMALVEAFTTYVGRRTSCPTGPPIRRWAYSKSLGCRKRVTNHRLSAFRLLLRSFVLNHIPVLDESPVFDSQHVSRDPVNRPAEARKSPVDYHEIAFGDDHSGLIHQGRRDALDEIEQAVATRLDMSALLDVVGRPEVVRRCVVTLN
jgi:hypothetical protein